MGGMVTQEGKPLGFFSKKLTNTEERYPITKQELLGIFERLKYVAWTPNSCQNRSHEFNSPKYHPQL